MDIYIIIPIYLVLTCFLTINWNSLAEEECDHDRESTLLVIAHPDDETMFFGPTLLRLADCLPPQKIFVVCLTSGDYYGQGDIRKSELIAALAQMKVSQKNIFIMNFKDGMDEEWPDELVAKSIELVLKSYNIGRVITFDDHGISGHSNHRDTFKGIKLLATRSRPSNATRFQLLESVNILRKYSSFTEITVALIEFFLGRARGKQSELISITPKGYSNLLDALYKHKSQMLWFRKLYSVFSRYMFINTLKPI